MPTKPQSIHKIKVERLTPEAFKPFGKVLDATRRPKNHRTFNWDRGFDVDGKTIVGVIWQPFEGMEFTQLERHFNVSQGFIPMSGSPSVVAVARPTDPDDPNSVPRPEDVRAFLIDGSVGFRYKVATWHSLNRYIVRPPGATFIILSVKPNPSEVVDYQKKFGVTFKLVV